MGGRGYGGGGGGGSVCLGWGWEGEGGGLTVWWAIVVALDGLGWVRFTGNGGVMSSQRIYFRTPPGGNIKH